MRDKLADVQHAIWSHWMKYMFTQGWYDQDNNWVMHKSKVERWERQMNTDYNDLTTKEQQSDLSQADKVLKVLGNAYTIKPLVWRGNIEERYDHEMATPHDSLFLISLDSQGYWWTYNYEITKYCESIEDCKAEAQAFWETQLKTVLDTLT